MAIELGNVDSMYELANFYQENNDYQHAESYYLMASERKHGSSQIKLARHYQQAGDLIKMVKYYLLAIKNTNDDEAFKELIHYFDGKSQELIKFIEQDIKNMLMYNDI